MISARSWVKVSDSSLLRDAIANDGRPPALSVHLGRMRTDLRAPRLLQMGCVE